MTYTTVAEISWFNNTLILKRGTTNIQINQEDSNHLRTLKSEEEFSQYFKNTALKNREARRVITSWEKKDSDFVKNLFLDVSSS